MRRATTTSGPHHKTPNSLPATAQSPTHKAKPKAATVDVKLEPKDGSNSRQVGGTHYKTGGEEHWDRVARLGLDYFQGQITKYVERWKKKNGIQDLEKAKHFLEKYIELVRGGKVK